MGIDHGKRVGHRAHIEGLAIGRDCLVVLACGQLLFRFVVPNKTLVQIDVFKAHALVVIGFGITGINRDGVLKFDNRLEDVPFVVERLAPLVPGLRIVLLVIHRFFKFVGGCIPFMVLQEFLPFGESFVGIRIGPQGCSCSENQDCGNGLKVHKTSWHSLD